jgi:hypothetical protein
MGASHDDLPFLIILCTCIRWRHDRRNCFTPTAPIGPFPIQLPNGAIVKVEVASTGREDTRFDVKQFQPVADAILVPRGYANELRQLTAVVVKGSGKGNLEITLEWEAPTKE